MKFIHTSDWHLGRSLHEYSLLEDQRYRLEQLTELARQEQVDAVVVAGDLYDRSVPPAQAVTLLDEVFYTLTQKLNIPVLAISGNHDSPQRLSFGSRLCTGAGLYLQGEAEREIPFVSLGEGEEATDFYLLPYFTPEQVRPWFPQRQIVTFQDAFAALMEENLPRLRPGRRHVLVAHGFYRRLEGRESQDPVFSQSEVSIGGADLMDLSCAAGFDYLALGHLHAPQSGGGEDAWYSGSLLKYSVSEESQKKGFLVVELTPEGCSRRLVSPPPLRELRCVRGTLEEVLTQHPVSEDYLMVTLTDQGAVLGAMEQLRRRFPHVLGLRFAVREQEYGLGTEQTRSAVESQRQQTPLELFAGFYQQLRREPLGESQLELLGQVIRQIQSGGESASEKEECR